MVMGGGLLTGLGLSPGPEIGRLLETLLAARAAREVQTRKKRWRLLGEFPFQVYRISNIQGTTRDCWCYFTGGFFFLVIWSPDMTIVYAAVA